MSIVVVEVNEELRAYREGQGLPAGSVLAGCTKGTGMDPVIACVFGTPHHTTFEVAKFLIDNSHERLRPHLKNVLWLQVSVVDSTAPVRTYFGK